MSQEQPAPDEPEVEIVEAEITYDEKRYDARPRQLRPRVQVRSGLKRSTSDPRVTDGSNPSYVTFLVRQSMLADADAISRQLSGQPSMWSNPYARPSARRAIDTADVWFTAYPISLITAADQSFLAAIGDEGLWDAFERIGIDAIHMGPVKRAGGLDGWALTASVDGHFDRISTEIDPIFGHEEEFRRVCAIAEEHGAIVIDDIIPGHTGKGADFRLAELAYEDYPGIYHMVEIPEEDWGLLPEVPIGRDSVNLDPAAEAALAERGFIIGRLQRVIFYTPGVKETNWSATRPIVGVDGRRRRWVYLHYFKEGQPSINWLDPTFSGMRLVIGDALHSLAELGTSALRLDANGFLGVERSAEGEPAWSEGHPLSEAANHLIGSMVRKVGGFTFQELNLSIEDIRDTARVGADLSYDFVNRPASQHALVTHDTEFLRLTLRTSLELGVNPVGLVHGMQNHDELTYELVHWATGHAGDLFPFRGAEVTGEELAQLVRDDLTAGITAPAADYNLVFTTNGIACTTASIVAAASGFRRLQDIGAGDVETVRRGHLLLAMFNAWQPGVIAISGWDLLGVLPVPAAEVQDLIASGDTRWVERGAHDLMGVAPDAATSAAGMPRGRSLYGSLPEQLASPTSFASRLQGILAVRREYGIAYAAQLDVPEVSHAAMLVLVHDLGPADREATLAGEVPPPRLQLTVLNFGDEAIDATVRSEALPPRSRIVTSDGVELGVVDELGGFAVHLERWEGLFLLVEPDDRAE